MPDVTFRLIESVNDPAIEDVHALMLDMFPQFNQVPPKERWLNYLKRPWSPMHRYFLLAGFQGDKPVLFSSFNYLRTINCGYAEFIAVSKTYRGKGVGRLLVSQIEKWMNMEAQRNGHMGVDAFFADMEDPYRMSKEDIEAERKQAIDPFERLKLWHHFGFWHVDMPFVIAPITPEYSPITMNIQICLPYREEWLKSREIPSKVSYTAASWVIRHWAPDSFRPFADQMRKAMPKKGNVKLVPLVGGD